MSSASHKWLSIYLLCTGLCIRSQFLVWIWYTTIGHWASDIDPRICFKCLSNCYVLTVKNRIILCYSDSSVLAAIPMLHKMTLGHDTHPVLSFTVSLYTLINWNATCEINMGSKKKEEKQRKRREKKKEEEDAASVSM